VVLLSVGDVGKQRQMLSRYVGCFYQSFDGLTPTSGLRPVQVNAASVVVVDL
jgi:hypothetical protein